MHSIVIVWKSESSKVDKNTYVAAWWDWGLRSDCHSMVVSRLLDWDRRKIEETKCPGFAHTLQWWSNSWILEITIWYTCRIPSKVQIKEIRSQSLKKGWATIPKGSVTVSSAAGGWNSIPQLAISETQANLRDRPYDLEGKDERDIRSRERGSIRNSHKKNLCCLWLIWIQLPKYLFIFPCMKEK